MASRTAARVFSATGTIGSRTVSAHLPSTESAYFDRRRISLDE